MARQTVGVEEVNKIIEGQSSSTFILEPLPEDMPDTDILADRPFYRKSKTSGQQYSLTPAIRQDNLQSALSSPGTEGAIFDSHSGGGSTFLGVGLQVAVPRYRLADVHRFLLTNPWHYACVLAKATAATELGYTWESKKKAKNVITTQSKKLTAFEERIYEKSHKDLSSILKEVSIDFFSTGNLAMEINYSMGGTLDCVYSIPVVTGFRHVTMPLYIQCLSSALANEKTFTSSALGNVFDVQAVMPLFMSKLPIEAYKSFMPIAQQEAVGYSEVIHETNLIPSTDPFYGVADILPALASLLGDNEASEYNLQFFENNAVPRFAVTISGGRVTRQVMEDIVDFFDKQIKQNNHRTIVVPLPTNVTAKFEALDSAPNEGSFIEYKKLNREEIAAVHRVPPSEIGLWESSNKANSSQQSKNYFQKVIQPYQAQLTRVVNRILQQGLGITQYEFEFINVEYTDEQERAEVGATLAKAMVLRAQAISSMIGSVKSIQEMASSDSMQPQIDTLLTGLVAKLDELYQQESILETE